MNFKDHMYEIYFEADDMHFSILYQAPNIAQAKAFGTWLCNQLKDKSTSFVIEEI